MGTRRDRARTAAAAGKERDKNSYEFGLAQDNYKEALGDLKEYEITDYFGDLEFTGVDLDSLERVDPLAFEGVAKQGKVADLASAQGYTSTGYGNNVDSFDAFQTNTQGLARRGNSGLSNVFNNLQVSTAGSEMAAQEADQSLAASQDLAAEAGTGAGGATALAAAAAKSKQGISADIDRQVKANEQLRAQGEQSLQRDMLGQDNLASNFDLGQSQFNVGAQNTVRSQKMAATNQARQFDASARNQQEQFNAGQKNQFELANFNAKNSMEMMNVGQSNAERMAAYGQEAGAMTTNATTTNNILASNAQGETQFDMGQAQGQQGVDEALYAQKNDILNKETERLNNMEATDAALGQLEAAKSDRRLKKSIKLIGLSNSGIKIYSFEYKNTKDGEGLFQGVMSDEIPAHAIVKHEDGFDRVNYNKLDVEFKKINNTSN